MRRTAMNGIYWAGLALLGFVLALAVLQVGLGRGPAGVAVASHEYDDGGCWGGECDDGRYDQSYDSYDRNRNRDRNRGAFSPGPFDDSPVDAFNNLCMPGATCHYGPPREGQPA